MPYSLVRERDGAGDSGNMSLAITPNPNGEHLYEHNSGPKVGAVMRVGSPYGRTYSAQDWWQTTPVTEIVEEWLEGEVYCIRFKTGNSTYVWKHF